jgi:hypothetical protein
MNPSVPQHTLAPLPVPQPRWGQLGRNGKSCLEATGVTPWTSGRTDPEQDLVQTVVRIA